jgi:predicted transcriptional regulator
MRTLVDLVPSQVEALDRLAKRRERSRAALIREAVDDYLGRHGRDGAEAGFGLWREAGAPAVDGLEFQERARGEW